MEIQKRKTLGASCRWISFFGILFTLFTAQGHTPMSRLQLTPEQTEQFFDFILQGEDIFVLQNSHSSLVASPLLPCFYEHQRVKWYQWHDLVCAQIIATQEQTYLSINHILERLKTRNTALACREKQDHI